MVEQLFVRQVSYRESYAAGVVKANEKSGMKEEEQKQVMVDMSRRIEKVIEREAATVHDLAFNLAPSPGALKLEKRIEDLAKDLDGKYETVVSGSEKYVWQSTGSTPDS
jgi:hypothetical protein